MHQNGLLHQKNAFLNPIQNVPLEQIEHAKEKEQLEAICLKKTSKKKRNQSR